MSRNTSSWDRIALLVGLLAVTCLLTQAALSQEEARRLREAILKRQANGADAQVIIPRDCNRQITKESGCITSPNWPKKSVDFTECRVSVITDDNGERVLLTFNNFSLEGNEKCIHNNYVEITDVKSGRTNRYCGTQYPFTWLTDSNYFLVDMRAPSKKGFNRFNVTYNRFKPAPVNECSKVFTAEIGSFNISNPVDHLLQRPHHYYNPTITKCELVIHTHPKRRISVVFKRLVIEDCTNPLVITDLLTNRHQELCGEHTFISMTSDSNQVIIEFHKSSVHNLQMYMEYNTLQRPTECSESVVGLGEIIPKFELISPNYPQPYKSNLDCQVILRTSPGNVIFLNFTDFVFEPPLIVEGKKACVNDFLEMRDVSTNRLFHLCDSYHNFTWTSDSNEVVLTCKTNELLDYNGFSLTATVVPRKPKPDCMSITTTNPFVLTSLNHPDSYPSDSKCQILLHQLPGHYITLDFQEFKLEGGACDNDYLELTTLASNTSARYCGTINPFSWTSDANEARITFKTSSWIELSGFKAESSALSRPVRSPENSDCNMLLREKSGRIVLPVNPDWPPFRGSDCLIVIHAGPREKILLHFVKFTVSKLDSDLDYVEIRDVTVSGNEHRSRYTGHLDPFTWTSSRNEVAMLIHDENVIATVTFTADYETLPRSIVGCERVLTTDNGEINWPRDFKPVDSDCDITIRTEPGKVIIITFEEMKMDSTDCSIHSMKIQDRTTKRTDLFCSTQWKFSWISESNEINIALKHTKYSNTNVKAHYKFIPRGPVSALNQFFSSSEGILSSLEHNRDDIVNKNCTIIIQVNPEHRIVLNVTDFLIGNKQKENRPYLKCQDEFVEFKDLTSGRTSVFCGEFDIFSLSSDSNLMSITFRINKYPTYSIFRARYRSLRKIEGCDNLSAGISGMISTPEFPEPYPSQTTCRHIIHTQPGSLLTFKFEKFDLTPEKCVDFAKVVDLGTNRMTKICGSHPLFSWTSDTNEVMVEFHLNENEEDHEGVKATYERIQRSLIDDCYVQLFDPTMPIKVPDNFVVKDPDHAYCQFYLHAEPSYNIQLTVEEFEKVEDCSDSGIVLTDIATARTDEYCDIANTFSWTAETNELHIGLFARKDTLPKFLARWTLTPRVVETIVNDEPPYESHIVSAGDASPVPVKLIFYTLPNRRIVLGVAKFISPNARWDKFPLTIRDSSSKRQDEYYRNITRLQVWVADSNEVVVDFHKSGNFHFHGGFQSIPKAPDSECNKVFLEPSLEFESINFPEFYSNNMKCDIVIHTSRQDLRIQVVFKEFWLEERSDEQCHDFLYIIDTLSTNLFEQVCGRLDPFSWTSEGNSLIIKMRTDRNVNQIGYRAEYNLVTRPEAADYCNHTYYGPSGNFASPNIAENLQRYRNNVLCYYFLKGNANEKIFIEFHFFDVELQMPCENDYLMVEDIASGKSSRICGAHPHLTWESDSNEVNITFITDDSQVFGGFNASYKMEIRHPSSLCDREFHSRSGSFMSPSYPSKYPNSCDCVYTIIGPTDHIVAVTFDYFNVEETEACTADYIEASSVGIGRKQRFCGEKHGFKWKSSNNYAILTFHSDHVVTKTGFSATYQVEEIENPSDCGHTVLTGNSGSFTSPGFPEVYGNNIDCKYTIITEPDRIIIITFSTLQLEAGTQCLHDYVELINYPESTGERRCNQMGESSDIWTSTGNHVVVNLHTDTSLVNTGFNATYTTAIRSFQPTAISQLTIKPCQLKEVTGKFDVLTSPGFPESYPPLTQCQTLITVQKKHRVVITLFFMDIEEYKNCDWDYVQFTDVGTSRSSEKLCGSIDAPLVWKSDTNEVRLFFKSDDILQRTGFYGTFHSEPIIELQPVVKPA